MKIFLTVFFSLALASSAMADNPTRPDSKTVERYKNMFDQLDTDGNGSLTLEEAAPSGLTEDNFQRLDEDGNGELNREEFIVLANDPEAIKGYDRNAPYGSDAEHNSTDDAEAGTNNK